MSKLELSDNTLDVIVKMSEGNPGAWTFLCQMLNKKDWFANVDPLMVILMFDTLELYGSKLYMVWNDICGRDLNKVDLLIRNWQMGNISKSAIHDNLSSGRGTPFTNLKSFEELGLHACEV